MDEKVQMFSEVEAITYFFCDTNLESVVICYRSYFQWCKIVLKWTKKVQEFTQFVLSVFVTDTFDIIELFSRLEGSDKFQ